MTVRGRRSLIVVLVGLIAGAIWLIRNDLVGPGIMAFGTAASIVLVILPHGVANIRPSHRHSRLPPPPT